MKGLIVFAGIITLAAAAPQYNYAQPSYKPSALYEAPQSSYQDQPIVSKQFFIHSAPEEPEEHGADKIVNLGPGRKHYRVVFIKAPHQKVQTGRLRVIAPQHEEKTVIYVLSKKAEASEIQTDVQHNHIEPSKPDVFFIKYKTPEEAYHAQKQIQAQYDSLGGTSEISDEGVAPLTSVIGTLGQSTSSLENSYIPPRSSGSYLPPNY